MSAKPKTVRADLGDAIREVFSPEWLREFAENVKGMTKGVWAYGECPDCGSKKKVLVEMPDLKGQLVAVTELMEQAEGRPGTMSGEAGGVVLVVERSWPVAGTENLDELRSAPATESISPL